MTKYTIETTLKTKRDVASEIMELTKVTTLAMNAKVIAQPKFFPELENDSIENTAITINVIDKSVLIVATLNHGFFWMVFFCISCPFTTLYTGLASTDPREYRFYD